MDNPLFSDGKTFYMKTNILGWALRFMVLVGFSLGFVGCAGSPGTTYRWTGGDNSYHRTEFDIGFVHSVHESGRQTVEHRAADGTVIGTDVREFHSHRSEVRPPIVYQNTYYSDTTGSYIDNRGGAYIGGSISGSSGGRGSAVVIPTPPLQWNQPVKQYR